MTQRIGIYLYTNVEVLDFAGPWEVFSTAARVYARQYPEALGRFNVVLISHGIRPIKARGGLVVQALHTIYDHPALDVLLIPGGVHSDEMHKQAVIDWIRSTAGQTHITASVCTGAFLLAQAGLLDGKTVTTHWEDIPDLQAAFPNLNVVGDQRWVEQGNLITSAGISAGIDMSLHLVARLAGEDLAERTARQMDYRWVK